MKAVLVDAGLTLLRAEPSLGGIYTLVTRSFGRDIPPAEFDRAAGAAFHDLAEEHRNAGESGLRTSEDLEQASWKSHARKVKDGVPAMEGIDFEAWFHCLYAAFGTSAVWTPFDDALPALDALRARGLRIAVVSNWDRRLHDILRERDVTARVDAVIVSSEVGWKKPHSAIFRAALGALGVEPGEALHVGDSVGDDMIGAEAVGIRPVLLRRDGTVHDEFETVRSLGEVAALA